jgi:hypothetical protein
LTAIRQWQDFDQQVKDPDDRKWHLLALERIKELEDEIKDRRQYIEKQVELANIAERAGRTNEALTIRTKLIDQFSRYTDLTDIFPSPIPGNGRAPNPPAPADAAASEKTDATNPAAPSPSANPPATTAPHEPSPPKPPGADPKHDQLSLGDLRP